MLMSSRSKKRDLPLTYLGSALLLIDLVTLPKPYSLILCSIFLFLLSFFLSSHSINENTPSITQTNPYYILAVPRNIQRMISHVAVVVHIHRMQNCKEAMVILADVSEIRVRYPIILGFYISGADLTRK